MIPLFQLGSQLNIIGLLVKRIFPLVDLELDRWRTRAAACPDKVLAEQALASIKSKKFHAQGGSVYALYPGVDTEGFVSFIVALQTISDYLDNLCDRVGFETEDGFRQVHLAMVEALTPGATLSDYYKYYPHWEDGEYLQALVKECQYQLTRLPSYSLVYKDVIFLARLYSELQTYKHLPLKVRENKMTQWTEGHLADHQGLNRWEFAAATGSTLGIFMLCAAAYDPELTAAKVAKIKEAYFPWVAGLHILLDYFIDQQEDQVTGDLNFVSYYRDQGECQERLGWFLERSLNSIEQLPQPLFHKTVVEGLLAMYLSDPKGREGQVGEVSKALLTAAGGRTRFFYTICRLLRKKNLL